MTWVLVLVAVFVVLGLSRRRPDRSVHLSAVAFTMVAVSYEAVRLHVF
jgi:hypothetical protein